MILITCVLWVALPLGVLVLARRCGLPALTVTAAACGVLLLAVVAWLRTTGSTLPPQYPQSHDTYFVAAYHAWLAQVALIYFAVALAFALIAKAGPGWSRGVTGPLFWAMHLGAAASVLHPSLTVVLLRGGSRERPLVALWSWVGFVGSSLSMLALAAIFAIVAATVFLWLASAVRKAL